MCEVMLFSGNTESSDSMSSNNPERRDISRIFSPGPADT